MIEFWVPAAMLLAAAAAFVLVPLLRSPTTPRDVDRTAQNVGLYQDRLHELRAQHQAGTLTTAQWSAARAEAARELLADTGNDSGRPAGSRRHLGMAWAVALLVPLLGTGLYLHWGSLDQVLQARQYAGHPEQSLAHMTARLEASVAAVPDSAEAWFFLGRTYLAQDRAADAARAFERAANLAGRPPELLGQWAQALYAAGNQQWTPQLQALTDEALAGDPAETASLTLAGMAAFEAGHYAEAAAYWERLAAALPADDSTQPIIAEGIARARARIAAAGGTNSLP